nr:hypothetical protein [Tanacetum cinerariifolium]
AWVFHRGGGLDRLGGSVRGSERAKWRLWWSGGSGAVVSW